MAEAEEQLREARERQRELEVSFAEVFGEAGNRDVHRARVWAWLEASAFRRRGMLRASRDGNIDPLLVAGNAACHDFFAGIERLVEAGHLPENPLNHPQPGGIRQ